MNPSEVVLNQGPNEKGLKNTDSLHNSKLKPLKSESILPKLVPDGFRRELFKYYYATQNPEKFDLFKKADACEFFQSMLELIHFCLNESPAKKDVDDICWPNSTQYNGIQCCMIHKHLFINV